MSAQASKRGFNTLRCFVVPEQRLRLSLISHHWRVLPRSHSVGVTVGHSDSHDHTKLPCIQPFISLPYTWRNILHHPITRHPSPSPLQPSKYSEIAKDGQSPHSVIQGHTSIPCFLTWSDHFSASFHSKGVPTDNNPILPTYSRPFTLHKLFEMNQITTVDVFLREFAMAQSPVLLLSLPLQSYGAGGPMRYFWRLTAIIKCLSNFCW
jgi:hypothetical protein